MRAFRSAVNVWILTGAAVLSALPIVAACSSGDSSGGGAAGPSTGGNPTTAGGMSTTTGGNTIGGNVSMQGGSATGGTSTASVAGSAGSAGTAGITGTAGMAGNAVGSGGSGGGMSMGGNAGNTTGGTSMGGSGADPCGMPPWKKLEVTAAVGAHIHGSAGLDTRAKTMLGKLVIDYGYQGGGYQAFLAKRGYHSIGAPMFTECAAPDLTGSRTRVGDCRVGEFMTTSAGVIAQVKMLQAQFPEEDWGYFLTQDGKDLRWSDVALTGLSHGATTAAVGGRLGACVWRVVSRSGPRDNLCGTNFNGTTCKAPLSTPTYNTNCPDEDVAAWLDQPSKTPMDRFYALVGFGDDQCGDIEFNMQRAKYLGVPTIFDTGPLDAATLDATHQFFSSTQGHLDFLAQPGNAMNTALVLEKAFAIPPENQNPKF